MVEAQLDRLLREAEAPKPDEVTLLRAQMAEMREQIAKLTAAQAVPATGPKAAS